MKKKLLQALSLLQRAFIVNRKAKRGYVSLYYDKVQFINEAIDLIVQYQLPIKYGWGEDDWGYSVVYFEYCGRQVSFHDPFSQINCHKKFHGKWIGVPQTRSPFSGLIIRMS